MPPIDLENAFGRAFRSTCWEAARTACPQLAAVCAAQWKPCDTKFWQRCDDGWTVDSTTRGGWQGSRAVQIMFVLGLEFLPSPSLTSWLRVRSRGLDDLHSLLERSTDPGAPLKVCWPKQVTDSVATNCRVWAPGFEQFKDAELPIEVRNLCLKIPRKRHGGEPAWVCGERTALHACRPGTAC